MINVFIAESSIAANMMLGNVLNGYKGIHVSDICEDGIQAVKQVIHVNPDIILMNEFLPGQNGYKTTEEIIARQFIPVIMMTYKNADNMNTYFKLLSSGAVDHVSIPSLEDLAFSSQWVEALVDKIRGIYRAHLALKEVSEKSRSQIQLSA